MADKNTILELGDKLNDNMNELYKKKIENIIEELDILKKAYRDLREVALELAEQVEELKGSTKGYEEEIAKLDDVCYEPDSEHKFKNGDKIKFVGKLNENGFTENGKWFNKAQKALLDNKPRKILSIDDLGDGNFDAKLQGIQGINPYHEDDFEKVEE